jgi:hypothetical protein
MTTTRLVVFAAGLALVSVGVAAAQYPILDMVAEKVVQKYAQSTCEQLWEQRGKPKSAQEQEVVKVLHGDAQMRTVFINKIAAPVANKMFECGMIP